MHIKKVEHLHYQKVLNHLLENDFFLKHSYCYACQILIFNGTRMHVVYKLGDYENASLAPGPHTKLSEFDFYTENHTLCFQSVTVLKE